MGRPPSNGGPSFRFNQTEVAEMEAILHQHNNTMPARELLVALAEKFSETAERKGKFQVQMKQVWNWFQNRRYAIRAKSSKVLGKLNVSPMPRVESTPVRNVPQGPQPIAVPIHAPSVPSSARGASENPILEFEAKSGRMLLAFFNILIIVFLYDVANFLSHRHLETGDPEVLVRFAGFGPEEDEWVNVRKHVRQRSLPPHVNHQSVLQFSLETSYFVFRKVKSRLCTLMPMFLVRYVHDQSEEIVPLRKVCRRPETDYRLQQLHAVNDTTAAEQKSMDQFKVPVTSAEMIQKQQNADAAFAAPVFHANASFATQASTPELKKPEVVLYSQAALPVISHGSSVGNMPGGN
ncbi:hypothetical protein M0R45_014714 [Rubus argutus]|uniref:Homeobox domain-containing protein n=1 Tax=Rubus argutus TaxID=59490 RepID=A0AAW1XPX6_RUBAR